MSTYGIPYELLTDNRTVFEYKLKKNPSEEKDSFTQYGYACQTLGIKLTTTSIPETKGKAIIERSVMENRNLSLGAKGLYSYIQSELTDNGTVKLDINKTCEEMNLSEFDFYRYMKELTSEKIYAI